MAEGMGLTSNLLYLLVIDFFATGCSGSSRNVSTLGFSIAPPLHHCLADSHAEEHTYRCGRRHGERTPEGYPNGTLNDARPAD